MGSDSNKRGTTQRSGPATISLADGAEGGEARRELCMGPIDVEVDFDRPVAGRVTVIRGAGTLLVVDTRGARIGQIAAGTERLIPCLERSFVFWGDASAGAGRAALTLYGQARLGSR